MYLSNHHSKNRTIVLPNTGNGAEARALVGGVKPSYSTAFGHFYKVEEFRNLGVEQTGLHNLFPLLSREMARVRGFKTFTPKGGMHD